MFNVLAGIGLLFVIVSLITLAYLIDGVVGLKLDEKISKGDAVMATVELVLGYCLMMAMLGAVGWGLMRLLLPMLSLCG